MTRVSSRIILIEDGKIALIERKRKELLYYIVPGGGVEDQESLENAAMREAKEELGVEIQLLRYLGEVRYPGALQHYYHATVVGGQFGTGAGPEFSSDGYKARGSYAPVWMKIEEITTSLVYPRCLSQMVDHALNPKNPDPISLEE